MTGQCPWHCDGHGLSLTCVPKSTYVLTEPILRWKLRSLRWNVIPWDLAFDGHCCNMNTASGFASCTQLLSGSAVAVQQQEPKELIVLRRSALQLVRRLRHQGVLWTAPVCSSWIWISRSSTGRSSANPLGDTSRICVQQGNLMVSRHWESRKHTRAAKDTTMW